MTQTQQPTTKAQRFVSSEVATVAARLSDNFTQPVTDKAIAREVKRQMGTWGQQELIRVFWGTGESHMYYVGNQTLSSEWGLQCKWVSPRRFIRTAAHALLCQEVCQLLKGRDLFSDKEDD